MKKAYLFITLNVFCLGLFGQTFDWAKAEGKYAYDYGYGASTDNAGNVYVAGKYEESGAVFSNTTVPCAGNHDGFLVKYAPNGDLQWVRTMGGTHGDYAQAVYCDKTSYVYIAGEMESPTANTPISFPGSTVVLNAVGDNDLFLAKYDLNGNLMWAVGEGSPNSEKALGVTADASGNVYICGYYTETTKINGTTINGKLGRNIYVAKYNKDGVFQWFKDAGSDKRDEAKGIACDSDGNVYICGVFNNNCVFGSQTLSTYNASGFWDAFLAKYDTNGNLQWVKTGGGDVNDGAWSIAIDNSNSIYISGEYAAYAVFSGKSMSSIDEKGYGDTYVAKYNSSGDIQWLKAAGSTKDDRARGMGTDGTHIFLTGQFGGTATFGGAVVTAGDTSDIYIAALDANGAFKWAVAVGGPADAFEGLGYESGNGITAFASGSVGAVYATGGLLDGGAFGSNTISKSGTRTDAFVTKVSWNTGMPPLPVAINDFSNKQDIRVFPNPGNGNFTLDLGSSTGSLRATVYNCIGQTITAYSCGETSRLNIDLRAQPEGMYLLELESEGRIIYRQKLIRNN